MDKFCINKLIIFTISFLISTISGQERCRTAGNFPGQCVKIEYCPDLLAYLKLVQSGEIPLKDAHLLRKSKCGNPDSGIKICCRDTKTTTVIHVPTLPPVVGPTSNKSGADLLESPETCGRRDLTFRITDGKNAKLGEWPWIVIFKSEDEQRSTRWSCGGVLISSQYVLSAAHCFASHNPVFARIGEYSLFSEPDCDRRSGICAPKVQDMEIEQVLLYPGYSTNCAECDDIALIRLAKPAVLHPRFVIPICLPLDPLKQMGMSADAFNGLDAKIAGWGSISKDKYNKKFVDTLQYTNVRIQELDYCTHLKRQLKDKSSGICAGKGDGKDSCNGDSGGPMVLYDQYKTKAFVVGLTSLGPEVCGAKFTQGLYTNVTKYIPWILSQLRP